MIKIFFRFVLFAGIVVEAFLLSPTIYYIDA